jgi:hypothetical protein
MENRIVTFGYLAVLIESTTSSSSATSSVCIGRRGVCGPGGGGWSGADGFGGVAGWMIWPAGRDDSCASAGTATSSSAKPAASNAGQSRTGWRPARGVG